MRYRPLVFSLVAIFLPLSAEADLPRTRVTQFPKIFGREAGVLILGGPITINRAFPGLPFGATMMVELPAGMFVPVSEDAEGVFYQSVKGVRPLRRYQPIAGGFYVSKDPSATIWAYMGNAKLNSKTNVYKDARPLPRNALQSLYVGKLERKK